MKEFAGRVAVITGAASGIGRALAERFAGEGMRLMLADVEEPALAGTAKELQERGATVALRVIDVSQGQSVGSLAESTYSEFGAVHLLCNNAGVAGGGAPAWEQSPAAWEWILGVNLWGVIHGINHFVPRMLAGGHEGHVVNTASAAGLRTGPLLSPYHASKHAVVALSESLHFDLQLAKARVSASVLCPAFVKTPLADSTRNQPRSVDAGQYPDAMRGKVEAGMLPERIAQSVFEAVRDRQFWILTHQDFDEMIRSRFEGILRRENPVAHVFGAAENKP